MPIELCRRNQKTATHPDDGTQQERRQIPRSYSLEKDETQKSLPTERKHHRQWIQNEFQTENQRIPVHQRIETRSECPERRLQTQVI